MFKASNDLEIFTVLLTLKISFVNSSSAFFGSALWSFDLGSIKDMLWFDNGILNKTHPKSLYAGVILEYRPFQRNQLELDEVHDV